MLGFLTVEAASLPAFGGGLRGGEGSGGVPPRTRGALQPPKRQLPPPLGPRRRQRRSGRAARQEVTPEGYCAPIPSGGGRGRGARGALRERRKIGGRSSGVPPRGPLALSTPPWRGAWRPRAAHAPLRSLVSPPSPRPRPIAPRGASARPRGALFQAKRGAKQRTEAAGAPPPSARLLRDEALQRGCGAWGGCGLALLPLPLAPPRRARTCGTRALPGSSRRCRPPAARGPPRAAPRRRCCRARRPSRAVGGAQAVAARGLLRRRGGGAGAARSARRVCPRRCAQLLRCTVPTLQDCGAYF